MKFLQEPMVIALVPLLLAAVLAWGALQERGTQTENRVSRLEDTVQKRLDRLEEKIDRLVDRPCTARK
jgi:hypothetical protein